MKKVVVIGHAYVRASNQEKLDIIARSHSFDIGVIAPSTWKSREWQTTVVFEKKFVKLHYEPVPVALFNGRSSAYIFQPAPLKRALAMFPRTNIIHVEQESYSLCNFQILSLLTKEQKLVVFNWENQDRQLPLLQRRARKMTLQRADAFIGGNEEAVRIAKYYGFKGPSWVLPQFGVNLSRFARQTQQELGSPFQVGYFGRFVPEKGIDTLLTAVQLLFASGNNVRLLLVGAGPYEGMIRALISDCGLHEAVRIVPAVSQEQVPDLMKSVDVLVLPSRSVLRWKEQFGHVLVEAMAMGIPVAGSSCGAIPEVIGREDMVFREGDSKALAELLQRYKNDEAYYSDAVEHGMNRVRKYYSDEVVSAKLASIWDTLCP